jgi:hypothetical protein
MAGLYTGAIGLWGGLPGLISSTTLSTPPSLLANVGGIAATGANLALWFDENQAYKSSGGGIVTPDSILTYTAPSPKMVYGSDGVLGYAPHNLFTNSNWAGAYVGDDWDPSGGWGIGSATGTATAGVSVASPDDISIRFVTSTTRGYLNHDVSVVSGNQYRLSFDLEAMPTSINWNQFFLSTGATTTVISYNGQGTNANTPPTGVGGRVYVDILATSTGTLTIRFGNGASSNTTGDITISRPMFTNLPMVGQTYYRNTSTSAAVYSLPRDYNPTTLAALGVLGEEQRTNLLTYSEQFDNAAWVKSRATVTGASINAIIAPDGTMNADKIVPSVNNATHRIYQLGITHGVLRTYAYTCYLKAGEYTFARLMLADSTESDSASCRFNLSDGTLDGVAAASGTFSSASASVVDVGNGWYRCTLIATCDATEATVSAWVWSGNTTAAANTFAGDGTSGIYAWGAQLEAGAFATSYIPTVASQVTRAADQISILTSAFPWNASAHTYVVSGDMQNTTGYIFAASNNASANREIVYRNSSNFDMVVASGAAIQVNSAIGGYTTGVPFNISMAVALNDVAASLNGAAVVTDTSVTLPVGIDRLRIGSNEPGTAGFMGGHIKRLAYYASRKTNAELQVLST